METQTSSARSPGPFGRFYLQELLNSGGMADIWLATDSNNKPYALRRMLEQYKWNFSAKRRFMRGCEILAAISDSEHIISYVEHGKIKGQPYLLMDYVEAENLKDLYAAHDPILTENVAQILIDMAGGLEHMHENGYMHLDFKPENVLVTRNGSVRLVDFDLAQPIDDKPLKLAKNPGTPAYMAPEQLRGEAITHRVDIFAFGVAAYELLTNQKP
ncbi:MAG TPA: serine/threonine-protein kinase, partial [Candidatus Polarisedimenticolia bacterium]|nr:serine/threonine-protein kinase [Candidatus Polarisedimenticolia bacterium]